jgi:hypothetical protein
MKRPFIGYFLFSHFLTIYTGIVQTCRVIKRKKIVMNFAANLAQIITSLYQMIHVETGQHNSPPTSENYF